MIGTFAVAAGAGAVLTGSTGQTGNSEQGLDRRLVFGDESDTVVPDIADLRIDGVGDKQSLRCRHQQTGEGISVAVQNGRRT